MVIASGSVPSRSEFGRAPPRLASHLNPDCRHPIVDTGKAALPRHRYPGTSQSYAQATAWSTKPNQLFVSHWNLCKMICIERALDPRAKLVLCIRISSLLSVFPADAFESFRLLWDPILTRPFAWIGVGTGFAFVFGSSGAVGYLLNNIWILCVCRILNLHFQIMTN